MTQTTETIDRLFLELSQFTQAKTARELALERQLAEAQRDAERFLWWFSKDRSSNGEIANLLLRQISGDSPTVIEWRNTIDAAIQEQNK